MELAKTFDPASIEARWYPFLDAKGYFRAGDAPGKGARRGTGLGAPEVRA